MGADLVNEEAAELLLVCSRGVAIKAAREEPIEEEVDVSLRDCLVREGASKQPRRVLIPVPTF